MNRPHQVQAEQIRCDAAFCVSSAELSTHRRLSVADPLQRTLVLRAGTDADRR